MAMIDKIRLEDCWSVHRAGVLSHFESLLEKHGRWPVAGYSARTPEAVKQADDLTDSTEIA